MKFHERAHYQTQNTLQAGKFQLPGQVNKICSANSGNEYRITRCICKQNLEKMEKMESDFSKE